MPPYSQEETRHKSKVQYFITVTEHKEEDSVFFPHGKAIGMGAARGRQDWWAGHRRLVEIVSIG